MNRINKSMNRINESNQWIESMTRINEDLKLFRNNYVWSKPLSVFASLAGIVFFFNCLRILRAFLSAFCGAGKGARGGAGPQMGHGGGPESSRVVNFGAPRDFPNFVAIVQTKTCVKFFFFQTKTCVKFFFFFFSFFFVFFLVFCVFVFWATSFNQFLVRCAQRFLTSFCCGPCVF